MAVTIVTTSNPWNYMYGTIGEIMAELKNQNLPFEKVKIEHDAKNDVWYAIWNKK